MSAPPATEPIKVGKPGRKPRPKSDDPMDNFGSTKVRKRIISHAKQVAEHRGLELWEYMEIILAPTVERDYHQMGVEIARRPKRGGKKTPMPEADDEKE